VLQLNLNSRSDKIRFHVENKNPHEDLKEEMIRIHEITATYNEQNSRDIVICQLMSWPNHGVPKEVLRLIDFIAIVKHQQNYQNSNQRNSPICVHCSTGVGRTGTFIAIDICINRIEARLNEINASELCAIGFEQTEKFFNVKDTVNNIRIQRAQSVQSLAEYILCYKSLSKYVRQKHMRLSICSQYLCSSYECLIQRRRIIWTRKKRLVRVCSCSFFCFCRPKYVYVRISRCVN